jgi:putative selenium metabolism protein SsnA
MTAQPRTRRTADAASLLVGPGRVLTPGALLEGAGVWIRAGEIAEIGPFAEVRRRAGARAPRLDARGGLVLPGAINAHSHFYSALARGMTLREAVPATFLQILERIWWRVDRGLTLEDVETSALLGLAECVRCGVTTVFDHHASPGACAGSLDRIRRAAEAVGVRAALAYEVSDRNGLEAADAGIEENLRFARALRRRPSSRIAALFGLHALFTLSEETLARCVAAAREAGLGLHLHLAEDRADVAYNLAHHGERPLERLRRHGGLGESTLAAHGVHLSDAEIAGLAAARTFLVHNPESNMNNAVGVAPVPRLLAGGARVGLGTDGMSADLFATARSAYLLHRQGARDPRLGWADVAGPLWAANAQLASATFGCRLGELAPGAAGDLIVLDYDPPTPLTAQNVGAHLVFGFGARHVSATVVEGRVLMRDRELLTIDESELRARSREQAEALWARL